MTTNKILTTIKELSEKYTDEELREAYALVFDMNMRIKSRGKDHKRGDILKAIISSLINLKQLA